MSQKDLVEHITKQDVLAAIDRIDEEGYASKRSSSSYDLVYNNRTYPPKYVLSLAGYFSSKKAFITHDKFTGGEDSVCFEKLRDLGFNIYPKEETAEFESSRSNNEINAKYVNRRLEGQLNNEKFHKHFTKYIEYCNRSRWFDYHEIYKFRFARWLSERVDFSNQSDQEILETCRESQNQVFHEGGQKGINFILSDRIWSKNREFINLGDIVTLRTLINQENFEENDFRNKGMAYPSVSIWAGTLNPDSYCVYSSDELTNSLAFLFNLDKYPKKNFKSFKLAQELLAELKEAIRETYFKSLEELVRKNFADDPELREVDLVWFVQDFNLFLLRRVLNKQVHYYWVNQGENYKNELEAGIIAAPNHSTHHHRRLKDLQEDDIIINYSNTEIKAVSKVSKEYVIKHRPYIEDEDPYLIVEVDYSPLDDAIPKEKLKDIFSSHPAALPKSYSPFNRELNVNQGYLFEFTEDAYYLIFPQNTVIEEANIAEEPSNPTQYQLNMQPVNKILYGPPGTGKTYTLKNQYLKNYLWTDKDLENLISNLAWWQVIALAIMDMTRVDVDEILDHNLIKRKTELSGSINAKETISKELQLHSKPNERGGNIKEREFPNIFGVNPDQTWYIYYSALDVEVPDLRDIRKQINAASDRFVFTTFHQSFSYEDFIEGIKPRIDDNNSTDIAYHIKDGIFKQICKQAAEDPLSRYAIFIDEINRGNVSAIFGELITLIEPDKRKGQVNELRATLPYSKQEFVVPANLDIYGTMNTADRSVEALDTALRRRFEFEEMPPRPDLIGMIEGSVREISGIDLISLLNIINQRIEKLIDKDHMIGHSYFLQVSSLNELKLAFQNKIIPLLQEYFFGDYGKIGLVLGEGFVTENSGENESIFAEFNGYDTSGLNERTVYKINDVASMNDESFIQAISKLMGRVT